MRFLTDENVATSAVHALREAGHDVFDVKEAGWQGEGDRVLIALAVKQRRIILTHDKDFLQPSKATVILARFYNQRPTRVTQQLLEFLASSAKRKLKSGVRVILTEAQAEFYYPL